MRRTLPFASDVGQLFGAQRRRFVKPRRQLGLGAGLKQPIEHHAMEV
jgi:hypothetical protein